MVQAIGGTAAINAYSSPVKPAGLEYQLSRYEKQLSECINCDSAKTPQGKTDIEAISNKISGLRLRIDQAVTSTPVAQVVPEIAPTASTGSVGATIDVFA